MAKKTMMLDDLISFLLVAKNRIGDRPVYLQLDIKGSKFGTIQKEKCFFVEEDKKTKKNKFITIQPFEENLAYEDLFEED